MSKPSTHALTLLASPDLTVKAEGIEQLQEAAVAQVVAVARSQRFTAQGAVLAGITLHRVKASLPRGAFGPFLAQKLAIANNWTPGYAKVSASYYMRLATVFIERAKVTKPDILALPGDQTTLSLGDSHEARALVGKLEKFVADCSLDELLIKHGIKGVGLKTELTDAAAAEVALTPEEQAAREAAERDNAWQHTWESVQTLRHHFTEPAKLNLITDPVKIEQLKAEVVEISKLLTDRLANLSARAV
jgi:hypothetical protein